MLEEFRVVNRRSIRELRRAKHTTLLPVIAVLLLCSSQVTGTSLAALSAEATPTGMRWETYVGDSIGITIRYPTSWHVYTDTMQGRHPGLNPILLASFDVEFEEVGRGLGIPSGGAALIFAFEGSDRALDQGLADYAMRCCGTPFYDLTGRKLMLGHIPAVEMVGEAGHLYVFGRGPNVYSVFVFAGSDPRLAGLVGEVLSGVSPLQDAPVPIPKTAKALWETGGEFVPLSEGPLTVAPAWDGPSMKMPWDRSASYRYTGGPHNWTMNWNCYLAPVEDACGLDFGMQYEEIIAAADGTVQWGYKPGPVGNYVIVDHGNGWSTRYLHLSQIEPSLPWGEIVSQGRVLGVSGTAGSGPHLHFEVRFNDDATTWHGTAVDDYVARMFTSVADESRGWNYQGTLTRGFESRTVVTFCGAQTYKWMGGSDTITAGDGQPVASTNQRHTGDPSPTETPTPTPTPSPTPVLEPNVAMDKAVVGADFQAGEPITFTLDVANVGAGIASRVVVTDVLPTEVEAPTFTSTLALTPTGILPYVWDVEGLGRGEGGIITITGRIRSDLGSDAAIVNQATIWDPEDSTPANNTDTVVIARDAVYLPLCLREYRLICIEGIGNGGFEWDDGWEITDTPYPADYDTAAAHSGSRSMHLGVPQDSPDWPSWSSVYQEITMPSHADEARLTFWYKPHAEGLWGNDYQLVSLLDSPPPATQLETILLTHSNSGVWSEHQFDLRAYVDQTVYLYFTVYNDGDGTRTRMYVDDVSLELCSPTSRPQ